MLRLTLIVCVFLIFGITASPYRQWNKPSGEEFQDTVLTVDDQGKMSWAVEEVEPPEDMDETQDDIDPRMRIWNTMTGQDQEHPRAQEEEAVEENEPDWDEVKARADLAQYLAPLLAQYEPNAEQPLPLVLEPQWGNVRVHLQPEEDMDDLYHLDPLQMPQDETEAEAAPPVDLPFQRKHTEPEEDLDHYHQL